MTVRFLDYRKLYTNYQQEIDAVIKRCLVNGKLILQDDVESFERRFAEFLGVKHVIGLNSGTDALLLALRACGVEGGEVITSAHTFKSTVGAIINAGATPITVDINEYGAMDLDEVEEKITRSTRAIIPVHLAGDHVNMTKLKRIAGDISIIEDACQGVGAEYNGQKLGTIGRAGAFSFYPAKILGCFGDGGAMATNDRAVAKYAYEARNHFKGNNLDYGVNSRLDNLQAAVLSVKLDYLVTDIKKREEVAKRYNYEFVNLPIGLPRRSVGRVYQDYIIRTHRRDDLHEYLKENGVETLKNEYPFTMDFKKPKRAKVYEKETLRLPCNHIMDMEEVEYVTDKVKEFYG